ncbi:VCBS repeat-containing protein [Streptomyces sp. NPDC001828]|uniref:VCBS repeat-containing protein n=1 Tax=Streptomyces sp. NPDC001828 TaxID=3364615 RepID=UPI0036A3617D
METSATTEVANAVAKAARSGHRVELLSRRTETTQVFANPSGTFTEERYATAQRVRQGNKLVDIDPTLRAGADGRLTPKATAVGLEFSGGGTGPLATITRDGRSMSLSWPASLPKPQVDGDSAVYPEVLPGVDLKLRAGAAGFGELLVVKSPAAAANPALKSLQFKLGTDGVSVSADANGNLKAVNPAGQEVFTAPVPLMWDSSTASSTGTAGAKAAKKSAAVKAAAVPSAGSPDPATTAVPTDEFEPGHGARQTDMPLKVSSSAVTLAPDQSLLTGKDTTYPVYIDPAVGGSREAWTIAYKKYPDGTFYNGAGWGGSGSSTNLARVGYENETNGLGRSFFRMDSDNLWNTNKSIISSTFRIKNTWSWSCNDQGVETWLTGSISSSTTWNNQPSWATKLATVNNSLGYSSDCPAGNLAFDVTSAAKQAATKHWPNITLGMRATSETDVYAWKKFDAGTAVLSTDYNTVPNAPSGIYTTPDTGAQCGATTPYTTIGNTDVTLGGSFSDPDGGTVKAHFVLWPTGHGGAANEVNQSIDVTSGKGAKLPVTKAALAKLLSDAGVTGTGTFTWWVRTEDGSLASGWSPQCHFMVDATRPSNPPGITSTAYPDGSEGWPATTSAAGTEGTFTLSSGNIADVAKYEYWTDWDPTVRVATPATAGGPVDIKLRPIAAGAHSLGVRSVDKAGNRSDGTTYHFYANSPATPRKPGDLNGDGIADFYATSTDGTLVLYTGQADSGTGQGNGYMGPGVRGGSTNFIGGSLTHRGDWTNDGFEDLLGLVPADGGKTLAVYPNNGLGWACTARDEQADGHSQACLYDRRSLDVYDPADNHWSDASQILAVGDVDGGLDTDGDGTIDVPGHADLLVKEGDQLWLYFGSDSPYLDENRPPVLVGNGGWSGYDLAAPGDRNGDGHVDLIARSRATGELRLYQGTGPNGEGLGSGPTSVVVGTNWTPANRPLFTAVPDANGDAKPDIWSTGGDGRLYFYPSIEGAGTAVGTGGWSGFQQIS